MNSNIYQLQQSNKRRRVGLSRHGHGLLSVIGNVRPEMGLSDDMSSSKAQQEKTRTGPLRQVNGNSQSNTKVSEREADILAPPKELSDSELSSSDDERNRAATIKPSTFKSGNGIRKPQLTGEGESAKGRRGVRNTLQSRNIRTKTNANGKDLGSPKRKSQEDTPSSSDIFGSIRSKKPKSTYGGLSQLQKIGSSQASLSNVAQEASSKKSFKSYDLNSSPMRPASPVSRLSIPSGTGLDSPTDSLSKTKHQKKATFKAFKDAIPESGDESDDNCATFELPDVSALDSPPSKSKAIPPTCSLPQYLTQPATQAESFQRYSLDGDSALLALVEDVVKPDREGETASELRWDSSPFMKDQVLTQVQDQTPICPMCGASVDDADLANAGEMSTRAQELFCRAHQRKAALAQWSDRNYPDISWDSLHDRINQYKMDIQKWIIGKPACYYRSLYSSALSKGENKNLRKMTSNLIPGYYGPKGSHIISEFVMDHFSELLRKRAPKDRVVSKGGVTAYVQAVVVMEVAAKLIAEDMRVEIEEAREILTDSVALGDLVWQEEAGGTSALTGGQSRSRVRASDDDESSEDELARDELP